MVGGRCMHTARAEMVVASWGVEPLAALTFEPDPLEPLVDALGQLRPELGDVGEVHVDLVPLTAGEMRRYRRRAIADSRNGTHVGGAWQQLLWGDAGGRGVAQGLLYGSWGSRASAPRRRVWEDLSQLEARTVARAEASKALSRDQIWQIQVLMRVRSPVAGRPAAVIAGLRASWQQWAEFSEWAAVGGTGMFGSDLWGRRQWFDRRVDRGRFRPARRSLVTTGEIAGLLKPPTKHCRSSNVVRGGGSVPPPPRTVPTYHGPVDAELLPLGFVRDTGRWRPVGAPLADTFFQAVNGRSREGKTERMIVQAVHLALAGHGVMFIDPHGDALDRMKPYLGAVADRVVELNLTTDHGEEQTGWNPLSMAGLSEMDIEDRVASVVSSFSSALGWTVQNNRAQTLTTMAAQSLCELGLRLPPELQPTIFQLTTVLSDEDWRTSVLPFLSGQTRSFWEQRFGALSADAITPVTNLIDRLRSSPAVAALFGSSESFYDVRAAMDGGQIVLACPALRYDQDRLIGCFFTYDVLRATLSRRDLPVEDRRPFYLFVDEQQVMDRAGILAAMLQQCGKFGLRVTGATQSLMSLTDQTRDAWLTNRSHLVTNATGYEVASLLSREWGGQVGPASIAGLDKYTSIGSFTVHGQRTPPFWLRGFEISDVFADYHDPTGPQQIREAVDVNLVRRPVRQTLADLDRLDKQILTCLADSRRPTPPAQPPRPPGPPADRPDRPTDQASASASVTSLQDRRRLAARVD